MKKLSRTETDSKIKDFFFNIKGKTPRDVKKIKKLAMSQNIKLKGNKKMFCKKCLTPYDNAEQMSTKNKMKKIICKKCGYENRWKIN